MKHKFEWDNKGNMKKPRVSNAQLSHLLMQERKEVAKFAQSNNVLAVTLRKEEKTLEEVFKDLTNK